uniref:RNA polymerase Rpb2 domain-containing protein n=1 Tax=Glossina brevipalpis TaxID=37001 RepID=A0A1A9WDT7_9MUSC
MIVLRARDILEHIIYDFDDPYMMEMIKLSLDEAFVLEGQSVALNFIGTHEGGARPGVTMDKLIKYAKKILQKEMFLRVGVPQDDTQFVDVVSKKLNQ